jgi:hypothetical protein
LIGLIVDKSGQQPTLIWYIRKMHDQEGKTIFEDANASVAFATSMAIRLPNLWSNPSKMMKTVIIVRV